MLQRMRILATPSLHPNTLPPPSTYMHKRQLLFLDEATSALDAESEALLLGQVLASRRQATGMAIVATGHGARLAEYFDRVIEMGDGWAREDGVV